MQLPKANLGGYGFATLRFGLRFFASSTNLVYKLRFFVLFIFACSLWKVAFFLPESVRIALHRGTGCLRGPEIFMRAEQDKIHDPPRRAPGGSESGKMTQIRDGNEILSHGFEPATIR